MLRRLPLLFSILAIVLSSGCGNEPYELLPLGVTEFQNINTRTTSTYKYKARKLSTFQRISSVDTVWMQFQYEGDLLISIVKDTTSVGYELINVYGFGSAVTVDSVFTVVGDVATIKEVRTQNYDANRFLTRVDVTQITATGTTMTAYELDWTDGNVSEVRMLAINEGTETTQHVLTVTYDDQPGVFSSTVPYVYTVPLDQLYWLSGNNPVRFKLDDATEVKYTYEYNVKGYPSRIVTDVSHVLGCSYAELR